MKKHGEWKKMKKKKKQTCGNEKKTKTQKKY